MENKKIIGITGRSGVGKSEACDCINDVFKIRLIDLDKVGHQVLTISHMKYMLKDAFGESIFENDEINRKALGDIVFNSEEKLKELNELVHPEIKEFVKTEIQESEDRDIIITGALIKEIGLWDLCHSVVVIDAEDEEIEKRIGEKVRVHQYQMSREEFKSQGDVVITNKFDDFFYESCIEEMKKLL